MNKLTKISKNLMINRNKSIFRLYGFIFVLTFLVLPLTGASIPGLENKEKSANINVKEVFQILSKEAQAEEEDRVLIEETSEKAVNTEPIELEAPIEASDVAYSQRYAMTAYNSEVAQCDDSPCITANGFNVCEHGIEDTVAANFLKFGTKVRIPELFGDRVFIVRDRMNARYTDRIDVWFLSHDNAIDFGVKYPLVEVLK